MQIRRTHCYTYILHILFTLRHGAISGQLRILNRTAVVTADIRAARRSIHVSGYRYITVHNDGGVLQRSVGRTITAVKVNRRRFIGTEILSHTILIPFIMIKQVQRTAYGQFSALLHIDNRACVRYNRFADGRVGAVFKNKSDIGRQRQVVVRRSNCLAQDIERNRI